MTKAALLMRTGCVVAALSASAVGAGCGASSTSSRSAVTNLPPALSPAGSASLAAAERRLTGRCARARGIDLDLARAGRARRPPGGTSQREFPYGIDDVAWARTWGFGAGGAPARASRHRDTPRAARERRRLGRVLAGDLRDVVSVRLPTGYVVAMSPDGCIARAQRRLYGDHARWFRANAIVSNLDALTQRRVTQQPAFRARERAWTACIARAGYRTASPHELRERFGERASHMKPQARAALERRMASADARCVRATGLAATGKRLERGIGAAVTRELAPAIAVQRRMARAALARIRSHAV